MLYLPHTGLALLLGGLATTWPGPAVASDAAAVVFVENRGQLSSSQPRYYARQRNRTVYLTPTGVVFDLMRPRGHGIRPGAERLVYTLQVEGADPSPVMRPERSQSQKANFLIGNRPERWQRDLPTYTSIRYDELYPGIDLRIHSPSDALQYDFILEPGSDPATIRLVYRGIRELEVEQDGRLRVHHPWGSCVQGKPIGFQMIDGRRVEVPVAFRLLPGAHRYGFRVGPYDREHRLVIDPTLHFSTYLGGSDTENGDAVAVDANGSVYLTGTVYSTNYPTQMPFQGSFQGGGEDIFVSKLSADGSTLVYSTYIGGSDSREWAYGIVVDSTGHAYVSGQTGSTDFPTENAFQSTSQGFWEAFVLKLAPAGNALVYSTYLSGSGQDHGEGLAIDAAGHAYVTGDTSSDDFPTQNPYQASRSGPADAFLTKVAPDGATLVFSTYFGGTGSDDGKDVQLDSAGNIYLVGTTGSTDFPTENPTQATSGGSYDAFVTKLNSDLSAVLFSTYLGGSSWERGYALAVRDPGDVYVVGESWSTDFPTHNAYLGSLADNRNGYVARLDTVSYSVVYATYLGGSSSDYAYDVVIDGAGQACVTGYTYSADFPTLAAYQTDLGGESDAFLTGLTPQGDELTFSTYFGGAGIDSGEGLAIDADGNLYVTGETVSGDFPTHNALQGSLNGTASDIFVLKYQPVDCLPTDATCDGIDDDCDDNPDDDYVADDTCGTGYCREHNIPSSCNGGFETGCTPADPLGDDDLTCDGVDDDCDTQIDEDYAPVATNCGQGACAASGTTTCASGQVQDTCAPGAPAPDDNTCDGQDDDCDGFVDEDAILNDTCGADAGPCEVSVCSPILGGCETSRVTNCCVADPECQVPGTCLQTSCDATTHLCTLAFPAGCCEAAGDCDDGNPCSEYTCRTSSGTCVLVPIERCCVTHADCDDGDPCTYDECAPVHRCLHTPAGCSSDNPCGDDPGCSSSRVYVRRGDANPSNVSVQTAEPRAVLQLVVITEALAGTLETLELRATGGINEYLGTDRVVVELRPDLDGDGEIDSGSEPLSVATWDSATSSERLLFSGMDWRLMPASEQHLLVAISKRPRAAAAGCSAVVPLGVVPFLLLFAWTRPRARRRTPVVILRAVVLGCGILIILAMAACGRSGFGRDPESVLHLDSPQQLGVRADPDQALAVELSQIVSEPFQVE